LLPRDGRRGADRQVDAAHRVGATGELVHQQFRAGVGQGDVHLGQRQVQFLGDHHRHRRCHALADFGAVRGERRCAVRIDDHGDQTGCRCRCEVLQVAEVEDLLGQRW
jgi:hypothetical protein